MLGPAGIAARESNSSIAAFIEMHMAATEQSDAKNIKAGLFIPRQVEAKIRVVAVNG